MSRRHNTVEQTQQQATTTTTTTTTTSQAILQQATRVPMTRAADASGSGCNQYQSARQQSSAQHRISSSSMHDYSHYQNHQLNDDTKQTKSISTDVSKRGFENDSRYEYHSVDGAACSSRHLSKLIDVMPIKVKCTLVSYTQQTDVFRSLPKERDALSSSSSSPSTMDLFLHIDSNQFKAPRMTALLSLCYLLLIMAGLGQCAPTKAIVSHPLESSDNLHDIIIRRSNKPDHVTVVAEVSSAPVHHHMPSKQEPSSSSSSSSSSSGGGSIVSSPSMAHHQRRVNELVALDDAEEETILLLLQGKSSPSSIRRLIKRSGISDQRLAEIQMIRALKKQLERAAATKITAESGNGGQGSANASDAN